MLSLLFERHINNSKGLIQKSARHAEKRERPKVLEHGRRNRRTHAVGKTHQEQRCRLTSRRWIPKKDHVHRLSS
jgi:hypothetical protein